MEKRIKLSDGSSIGFDNNGNITTYNCLIDKQPFFNTEQIMDIERMLKKLIKLNNKQK